MRLAFDKPAIIIIDDKTDYSFDTSLIEHLTYPRDLRYFDILEFKNQLKGKILATVNATKTTGSNNTSFLKNFGEFEVAHVEKKKGTIDDVLLNKIDEISRSIFRLERRIDVGDISRSERRIDTDELFMSSPSEDRIKEIIKGRLTDYSRQYFVSLQGLKLDYPILPDKLIKYMEENSELRALCHNRSTLERYLRKVIMES
ncbi:MAG: hypothetical protein IKX30_06275, partial [Victivallales bacterium]|nr:hypothetical protein [Victivallales bacterium]